MSFLDATGLGTFWGKLKNYFIPKSQFEAPIENLHDVLTPVNKWNNSAFTKNTNGIVNPITASSFAAGTNVLIANETYFSSWRLNLSNLTITRASNLLTIQFTLDSIANNAGYGCVMIESNNSRKPLTQTSLSYSAGSQLVSITDPATNARLGVTTAGTATVIFREEATVPNTFGRVVFGATTDSGKRPALAFYVDEGHINKTVSFSIRYPYAYEGEFENPPYKESLDCCPNNPYLLTDYSNVPYFDTFTMSASATGFTAGYRRIMNLNAARYLGSTFYECAMDIMAIKSGINVIGTLYDIKVRIALNSDITLQYLIEHPDAISLYFHGFRQSTNTTFRINKLAVVTDGTELYLAVNCTHTIGGTFRIHPSTARILARSTVTPWDQYIIYDGSVHSGDTVIKEVTVVEGF